MSLATLVKRSHDDAESWRYTDLDALLARQHSMPIPAPMPLAEDATSEQTLVFINGVWKPEHSRLGSLPKDAMQGDAASGYRLFLAAHSCMVAMPIIVVFVVDGTVATVETRVTIDVGANTSASVVEHHKGNGKATQVVDMAIHLGAQSKLIHNKFWHPQPVAAHLAHTTVQVAAGAYYRNFAFIRDTALVRNEIDVTLAGTMAQTCLNGIMMLRERQHADTCLRVAHAAPEGISRQLYKTILDDQSRGVFQGKIAVAAGAQKTDGRQLSRALLLSDQAEMDSKPELEILADDVACSHGATIGDLDADALFYLRARGLDESSARGLLLRGFVGEVVEELQSVEGRDYVYAMIEEWMHAHA